MICVANQPSPSNAASAPSEISVSSTYALASAEARVRQGAPRVTKNCLSAGRWGLRLAGSPPSLGHHECGKRQKGGLSPLLPSPLLSFSLYLFSRQRRGLKAARPCPGRTSIHELVASSDKLLRGQHSTAHNAQSVSPQPASSTIRSQTATGVCRLMCSPLEKGRVLQGGCRPLSHSSQEICHVV